MNITFNKEGLVPVITQDAMSKDVLMLAYMNEEALNQTMRTKKATYFSRSKNRLWVKGETSGNTQEVVSLYYDCDQDALLLKVIQKGVACHTGNRSCFYTPVFENDQPFDLNTLNTIILDRKLNPKEGSYTKYLFDQGLDKVLKKVGEESAEVIIASKNNDDELIEETSDLLYHLVVLLVLKGISVQTIFETLQKRQRVHDKT
jgi:phosphoribosyl-ATP pyrophosphohydrolase/phosphoribosyl-AMP cyclohydrolase